MNQRGEITMVSSLLLFTLMSIVLLSALELKKSFHQLEKRTHLFLCVKETKGEIDLFLKFMGRTNWGIKNIHRASLIMMFIPGAQGVALKAHKLKKYIQYSQNVRLVSYLKTLSGLKNKKCSLDPRMFITPFKTGTQILQRDENGAAVLREEKWSYIFFAKPYLLTLKVSASQIENVNPSPIYLVEEKGVKLQSLLSLP